MQTAIQLTLTALSLTLGFWTALETLHTIAEKQNPNLTETPVSLAELLDQ